MDQSPLETAHNLSNVASTSEEQKLAEEAVRIADHEVDIAFASALQQAQLQPPAENSETKELNARIRFLDSRLQAVQEQVSRLTKLAANPGKNDAHAVQQQLEIAQARAALLQDGLDDAKEDLVRAAAIPRPRSSRNWRSTRRSSTAAAMPRRARRRNHCPLTLKEIWYTVPHLAAPAQRPGAPAGCNTAGRNLRCNFEGET